MGIDHPRQVAWGMRVDEVAVDSILDHFLESHQHGLMAIFATPPSDDGHAVRHGFQHDIAERFVH